MAVLELNDVCFQYPDQQTAALSHVSISVNEGDFVLLCGPSGCGKTTLLRQLKKELRPFGQLSGEITFKGEKIERLPHVRSASEIGMVMQDPDSQIVMDQVLQELVFTLENVGCPTATIRRRVAELCSFFGMETWLHKTIEECSGGQKQLLNLASVMLLQPALLLLDEPTAQLDPVAARELLQMVHRLNQELGVTVVMTEHRIEDVFPMADKVVLMADGSVACQGSPDKVIREAWQWEKLTSVNGRGSHAALREFVPSVSRLYLAMQGLTSVHNHPDPPSFEAASDIQAVPVTVRDARERISLPDRDLDDNPGENFPGADQKLDHGVETEVNRRTLLSCHNVEFRYAKDGPPILNRLSLEVRSRELLAVMGGNGSGKTTLLRLIAGLLKPQSGSILFNGQKVHKLAETVRSGSIGYLAQNPLFHFLHDTVRAELIHAVVQGRHREPNSQLKRMIDLFSLQRVLDRHPYDCSGGEKQKVALATVLLTDPELLLLDEPTKGLDPLAKLDLADMLLNLSAQGYTIVMVTHDVEFAAKHATRCAMLFDGEITAEGRPDHFFADHLIYTTVINRAVRHKYPYALTIEDVLKQWRESV